jgi:hypothetical protein
MPPPALHVFLLCLLQQVVRVGMVATLASGATITVWPSVTEADLVAYMWTSPTSVSKGFMGVLRDVGAGIAL